MQFMNLLAFDTSTDVMSIAVQRGLSGSSEASDSGALQTWQHTGAGGAQASSTLIPAILQLMQQAHLRFDQLDAVAFGRGPGSFTGLRTACSVAQGLAFGAGVPVLPVDTLLAVAEEARYQTFSSPQSQSQSQPQTQAIPRPFQVLAVLDARMDEVYAAEYEFDSERFIQRADYQLIRPENLVLRPGWQLAGNAVQAYGDRLPGGGLPGELARHINALPTALALLRLAPVLLAAGQAVAADQALPLYIRDKVAKTTSERMQEKREKTAAGTHNA